MRLAWLTDVHLNFLGWKARASFYKRVLAEAPDAVLVGGDIGEAPQVVSLLGEMEAKLALPIYFVLGNHDFYGGSIVQVRAGVRRRCEGSEHLHWLPRAGAVAIGASTGLLGHDSWADGRFGDYEGSNMVLNDFFLIREMAMADKPGRLCKMRRMADAAAAHFAREIPKALRRFDRVFVLTHVPPFREACWYMGRISDDGALPHFACKAVGDVLAGIMRSRPDRRMTVLCGHTHGHGHAEILPNLTVLTGGARYGEPEVQRVFEIP